jgi:hypothetical protein
MNENEEQVIGRISALESIVCQLLALHLMPKDDKERIIPVLRDGISNSLGKLSAVEKTYALDCANRIFESAHAKVLQSGEKKTIVR